MLRAMTWMQRLALELEHGSRPALAWLLGLVLAPWREAAALGALLADAQARRAYRWQLRFAEQLLRMQIRARAAQITIAEEAGARAVRGLGRRRRSRRRVAARAGFRLRSGAPACAAPERAPDGEAQRRPAVRVDAALALARLLLRARALERALPRLERYAWRWARACASRAAARPRLRAQPNPAAWRVAPASPGGAPAHAPAGSWP
jgi:hypothetical protein